MKIEIFLYATDEDHALELAGNGAEREFESLTEAQLKYDKDSHELRDIYRISATGGVGNLDKEGFNVMGAVTYRNHKMLRGSDRFPLPWPAADRWGVELFAAQVDAMARDVAIRPVGRLAEWSWMNALALVGAVVGHRLRDRSRVKRVAVLATIAVIWGVAAVAWYHATWQLIGVPYDIVALFLGAWLANRNWRRPTA